MYLLLIVLIKLIIKTTLQFIICESIWNLNQKVAYNFHKQIKQ